MKGLANIHIEAGRARVFEVFRDLFLGATKKAFHKDMVDLKRVCERS